jgi:hypothetical protein
MVNGSLLSIELSIDTLSNAIAISKCPRQLVHQVQELGIVQEEVEKEVVILGSKPTTRNLEHHYQFYCQHLLSIQTMWNHLQDSRISINRRRFLSPTGSHTS